MSGIKNSVKRIWASRFIFLSFILMLVFSQFLLQYREDVWPKMYMLIALVAGVLVLLFANLKNPKAIARNTFVLIAFLGIANSLIMPIRQNLDENTHYYYALQIADGKARIQTDEMNYLMVSPDFLAITKLPSKPGYGSPENTNLYTKEFLELDSLPADYSYKAVSPGKFNNPAYLPSALGIKVGRLISDKLFVSYYMGRIFNLIFYALLAYLAVKRSQIYKKQLFLMATIPYALWIPAGYSYDSLYYGLILLVFAQLTNFLDKNSKATIKQLILYELTCLLLIFCKAPVIVLAALPIFLPKETFDINKARLKIFCMGGIVALIGGTWLLQESILRLLGSIVDNPNVEIFSNPNVNRMGYFIAHPFYSLGVLIRSFFDMIATTTLSVEVPQPFFISAKALSSINLFIFTILILLVIMAFHEKVTPVFKISLSVIIVFIAVAVIYAISGDSRVFSIGDLYVAGVQGRYHYYILVALPLLFADKVRGALGSLGVMADTLNQEKLTTCLMTTMLILNFLNTAIAVFGYL
ncbi:DUF2142 domain-containing protein [Enterococcus asini]|uniref:DUF2142 domain-containing protein n=1 Tax=Enterococcus asini TaxID=57732 RepID=UPI00288DBA13|nr:DUF2142 domain-containing protein [Enterococcus asini]MDT2756588.1 DUF2142 domain-containing protein [Enterococcus asini]